MTERQDTADGTPHPGEHHPGFERIVSQTLVQDASLGHRVRFLLMPAGGVRLEYTVLGPLGEVLLTPVCCEERTLETAMDALALEEGIPGWLYEQVFRDLVSRQG